MFRTEEKVNDVKNNFSSFASLIQTVISFIYYLKEFEDLLSKVEAKIKTYD